MFNHHVNTLKPSLYQLNSILPPALAEPVRASPDVSSAIWQRLSPLTPMKHPEYPKTSPRKVRWAGVQHLLVFTLVRLSLPDDGTMKPTKENCRNRESANY